MARTSDRPIDLEAALLNPAGCFAEPGDVLAEQALTREQKLRILRQWDQDARQLAVAEEENMTGGEENMVGRVSKAILALGGDAERDQAAPTKLG
ncbi:MAG: hypothetical protein U1E53_32780 [Dongiaceae bacterium]